MSDSAETPGSESNSTTTVDTSGSGTKNSTLLPVLAQNKAPPPSGDNAPPPTSNSPPSPPPSNGSPPPASPPPKNSPPQSSPPPSSSPPQSSPPPSSPPPSSSSSPPPSSPPPSNSEKSPPPSSDNNNNNDNQPSPPSPPPPEKSNSAPSNNTESPQTWSPPPPPQSAAAAASPPPPTTEKHSPPANTTSSALSPPTTKSSSPRSTTGTSPSNSSPSSSTSSSSLSSSTAQTATIVGATAAGVFLLAFIAIFFVVRGRRKKRDAYAVHYMPPPNNYSGGFYYNHSGQHPIGHPGPVDPFFGSQVHPSPMGNSYGSQKVYGGTDSGISSSKTHFSYEEMMEITNGFSRDNVIGEGGFGCVYKGTMSDGKIAAIKQLKAGSGQGEREFRAEVEIISRVHHRHLVSLFGYCISDQHRLLIYEFVPNNTLEHHLHAKGLPVLDWDKRVKIAIGSAKGLAYLHEDCHPKIIHRDIKSANILLDNDFEAQVADFGLARLNDTTQTHVSTRVMGTFGYLAPEYASSGKLTDRSDVYSFGVVLLELITGRKPVDASQPLGDESLVEWARPILNHALETGDMSALVDPRLENQYVESEMFRMVEAAAACVRHSGPKRPRMVKVVRALDSEGEMSDLSNGVKYGQSTVYDSGQYNQEIMKFRRMALGMDESSEFSGDYTSREMPQGPPSAPKSRQASSDFTSGESETRAINQNRFNRQF